MVEKVREVEQTVVQDEATAPTSEPTQAPAATRRVETTTTRDGEDPAVAATGASTPERIIYYITGVIVAILAFRFVLSLLGANRANAFADVIFSVSYPFAAPFFGLFGYQVEYGVSRFEVETLVAMAVYGIVAFGIAKLIRIARKEA